MKGAGIEGPYRCESCGCEVMQGDPAVALNQAGYEKWLREQIPKDQVGSRR